MFKNKLSLNGVGILFFFVVLLILFFDYLFLSNYRDSSYGGYFILFSESDPTVKNLFFWMRSMVIAFVSWCLIRSIFHSLKNDELFKNGNVDDKSPISGVSFEIVFWQIAVYFSLTFIVLYIFSQQAVFWLSRETRILESTSAIFMFSASFLFFKKIYKDWKNTSLIGILFVGGLAMLTGFAGGEELSWFQRIFLFDTPEWFSASGTFQRETNIHNLASNDAEVIFFFGAFLLFTILPLLKGVRSPRYFNELKTYFPGIGVFILGVLTNAFNYDLWDTSLIQLTFFSGVIATFYLLEKIGKVAYLCIVISITVQSVILLVDRDTSLMPSRNPVTEYREFMTSACFLLYSIQLYYYKSK